MKTILLFLALAVSIQANPTVTCGPVCTPSGAIPGTQLTALYARPKLIYTVTGSPGTYRVDITFMEWVYSAPGKRPLSVAVNGADVLRGFDIVSAGGYLSPIVRSYTTVTQTGTFSVVISNDLGNSAIASAVQVTAIGAPTPIQPDAFLLQFGLSLSSPGQLSVNAGNAGIGGITFGIPTGTVSVTAGSGLVRIGITTGATPHMQAYADPGIVATCAGGCVEPITSRQFGDGDIQIGAWSVTNGVFDIGGYSDMRARVYAGSPLIPITGITTVQSGHSTRIGATPVQ